MSFALLALPVLISAMTVNAGTLIPRVTLPEGWSSLGCYSDFVNPRTLSAISQVDSTMTVEQCVNFCAYAGYSYAGVEYADECYCDSLIHSPGAPVAATDCNMPCAGDATETCGAGNRINVYWNGAPNPSDPSQLTVGYEVFQSLGCYTDPGPRTLPTQLVIGEVSLETCAVACAAQGYSYFGTEYGQECWCGSSITSTGLPASSNDCSMLCNGDPSEFCGGPNRLNLYQFISQNINTDSCRTELQEPFDAFLRPKDVPDTDGTNWHQLVDHVGDDGRTYYVITACVEGCNVNGQNFYVRNRQLYVNGTDLDGNSFYAEALPLVMGETPMMVSSELGNEQLYDGYCFSAETDHQPFSFNLNWAWLEAQNSKELWYTCTNTSAGAGAEGRLDIVYAAYKNHPNYVFEECTPIYVEADYAVGVAF